MEIASSEKTFVRRAVTGDSPPVTRLLQTAAYAHVHSDWRLPSDWLGSPGFVVKEAFDDNKETKLIACLAVAADPPPASWVRVAAILEQRSNVETLASMFEAIVPHLRAQGVSQIGWLMTRAWPQSWLRSVGFVITNKIITFERDGCDAIDNCRSEALIRKASSQDLEHLLKIEKDAFEPLWWHSLENLESAWQRAICFDVALIGSQIVGFQYSVPGFEAQRAHLARITVSPDFQGAGIGSSLLCRAFEHYRSLRVRQVSLNTQADNDHSKSLYKRFGFVQTGYEAPVWVRDIGII